MQRLHTQPNPSIVEPGEDQRWSTWPQTSPTQRGPLPHPDWIVTEYGAFDTELGVLKSGKEADVYLIERAVPTEPGVVLAAKRDREHTAFNRTSNYDAGKVEGTSREARAMKKKTASGRTVAATKWAYTEFEALCRAHEASIPVPYPVQIQGPEIIMEFIGSNLVAAPRLAQSGLRGSALENAFEQVVDILHAFARAGYAHGDMSPYNLLVHEGRVIVIDLPQVIDIVANPLGMNFLHRDVVNICNWFARRGQDCDAEELFASVIGSMW